MGKDWDAEGWMQEQQEKEDNSARQEKEEQQRLAEYKMREGNK